MRVGEMRVGEMGRPLWVISCIYCACLCTGDTKDNPFWNFVRDLLHDPTPEQIKCHAPKPILLDTGYITIPYPWQPSILPLQLLRVGQLVIIGVPAEFTLVSVCVYCTSFTINREDFELLIFIR